jgi:hypothetical protein
LGFFPGRPVSGKYIPGSPDSAEKSKINRTKGEIIQEKTDKKRKTGQETIKITALVRDMLK